MSKQFNALIADQRVIFRGTSRVGISTSTMPSFRAITGAIYGLSVSGGISGSFGVAVYGHVGGTTYLVAGLTTITTSGTRILYRGTYSQTGVVNPLETVAGTTATIPGQTVPPSLVEFSAVGIANAIGISAYIAVSACISAD